MIIIYNYIIKKCFINITGLSIAFAIIYFIINLLTEVNSIGKGGYDGLSAIIYLIASLPSYIYLLLPLAVLIGVMMSMLVLVKNSEYAIIRTSGVSLFKISTILLFVGFCGSVLTFVVGEFIAPKANIFAKEYKLSKINFNISTKLSSGIWTKDGENTVVNIQTVKNDGHEIGDIQIFKYNEKQELQQYIRAKNGIYKNNHQWLLLKTTLYNYTPNKVKIVEQDKYLMFSNIKPDYFAVLVVLPEDMSIIKLYQYINYLKSNHQTINKYSIAFWNKIFYPFTCIAMALVTMSFIPTNSRNVNFSSKLFIGILVGLMFFFISRLISFLSVIYDWNPLVVSLPLVITFISAIILAYSF